MSTRRGVMQAGPGRQSEPDGKPVAPARFSLPGLLLAMILVSTFAVAAGAVSSQPRPGLRPAFALGLSAGFALALSLLPSRRQLPVFLLILGGFSVAIRLSSMSLSTTLAITLANLAALVVFRVLALRYAAAGRRLDDARSLLSLLGCGLAAGAVSALCAAGLTTLGIGAGWIQASGAPSVGFIVGTRLAAQCDGIVTVMPLLLMLMRRRPGLWRWAVWVEIGSWLALQVAVSVVALKWHGAAPVVPLALLVAFAGLVFAVMRRGSLAAAVLTPAFAVAAAAALAATVARSGSPSSGDPVLFSQAAAFLAALLAWAVATMVTQRETARRLAQSQEAAAGALTTLQAALLPSQVASSAGVVVAARYRAAGAHDQIGGDWYDTITLPSGGTALVIGDVEGHDLTAASVMGLVRGAVRSYALEGHPPSIVMERVSAFLVSAGIDRIVTMAYVQLYPGDTIATVAVAGHPRPLVVRRDGVVSVLETRAGPLLGLEGLTGWTEQTVYLPRDASLVLYTDGLTDFPTAGSDQQERLAALAAQAAAGSVELVAEALISAATSYDDAAVLVARQAGSPAQRARRVLPAQPVSASIARTWLTDLFEIWGTDDARVERVCLGEQWQVAPLLLTELVSNAVRHTDRWLAVRLHRQGQRLWVGVEDSSDRMPVLRHPDETASEGRGLRLVDALASAWGVGLEEHGKTVWFALDPQVGGEAVAGPQLLAAFARQTEAPAGRPPTGRRGPRDADARRAEDRRM